MTSFCCFYSLNIEPTDIGSGKIKNELDLYKLRSHPNILKNEAALEKIEHYFPEYDFSKVSVYLANFEKDGYTIHLIFLEFLDIILMTSHELRSIEMVNLLDRHRKYINNLTNKHWHSYNLSTFIEGLSSNEIYDLRPLDIPKLQTRLFDYQVNNIHWMLEMEMEPIKAKITDHKCLEFPDGRVYNYTKNKMTTWDTFPDVAFKGGVIADEMGVGKTLQILSHCARTPAIRTIVVVPKHLEKHWKDEMVKHFGEQMASVVIMNFQQFFSTESDFERLVVDEIHETYAISENIQIFEKLVEYPARYKWGVSGTPFACEKSLFYLVQFLTGISFMNYHIERTIEYFPAFAKLFRKNTVENAQKFIHLPAMNVQNRLLTFIEREMQIYLAESSSKENADINFLRRLCCDVIHQFSKKERTTITEEMLVNIVMESFHRKWQVELAKEEAIMEQIKMAEEKLKKKPTPELEHNIEHFKQRLRNQGEVTENRKRSYDFFKKQVEESSKTCPICTSDIDLDNGYCLTPCSHIVCSSCAERWFEKAETCPVCRTHAPHESLTFVINHVARQKYSTKIAELVSILQSGEQFIVYTQFESIQKELEKIFMAEFISFCTLNEPSDIEKFRDEKRKCLLILSGKNASGLDLSFVNNVVIFEPIVGSYNFLRDTERQIIGRVYRMNQTKVVNVFRLIVRNTIEEELYKELL